MLALDGAGSIVPALAKNARRGTQSFGMEKRERDSKDGPPAWDERGGHWDVDDGDRNRTRWLPNGTQVDHDNKPIPMSSPPGSGIVNFVREHPVAVGVGVVIVGGTVIFLTGGAAAPALALAF
jgi:hypothetical protein